MTYDNIVEIVVFYFILQYLLVHIAKTICRQLLIPQFLSAFSFSLLDMTLMDIDLFAHKPQF